jgi:hypothetical protein
MQKKANQFFLTTPTLFAVVIFLPSKVAVAEEAGTVGLNVAQTL